MSGLFLADRLLPDEQIGVEMAAAESGEMAADSAPGAPVLEVSRALPQSVDEVWQVLTTPAGAEALLGKGAQLGGKGEPWRSVDGSHGVVRSYHPMEQVRLSWHSDEQSPATLVELHLLPEGEGTRLSLRYEQVADAELGENLRQRWGDALGRIVAATPDPPAPPEAEESEQES
jgi:uncharacterized protein YndB with AHSA1/START domain